MERLMYRGRSLSWWSQGFLVLIVGLLISVFMAPIAHAADDTYSIDNGKITIQSGALYGGTYTDGDTNSKVQCSPTASVAATISINQDDKTKVQNGETPNTIRYSIVLDSGAAANNSCPRGERTATSSIGVKDDDDTSSCKIDGFGWLICAPSLWIANAMDWIYETILSDFLETQPLETTNTSSVIYKAWDVVRGLANTVFIIAFLFIVYSQLTSLGINTYGIKKLAPRLVVAAVLVNLSYYICAIGVDISNILGHAVKEFLDNSLATILHTSNVQLNTGELITKTLGGTALAIGGITLAKGALLAAAPLILPTLLMLFLSALVAILILAVRQALIIILIIIAPLAFVAYILPGTEKWFEKWRSMFFTMLIFFPAFAFVFGGANMAGTIISMTAGDSVIRYILGWIVQFAPLAITPLIMKLGGGVLNRFAGIVNNPNKGIVDKSKQWAEKKSKQIGHDRTYGNNNLKKRNFLRRTAQRSYQKGKLMDDQIAEGEKRAENLYRDSAMYKKQDLVTRNTNRQSELISNKSEADYNIARAGQLTPEMKSMQRKWNGLANDKGMVDTFSGMQDLENKVAIESLRKSSAQRVLEKQLADNLSNQTALRQAAGSPEDLFFGGNQGSQRVLAEALKTVNSANEDAIKNAQTIINHSNFTPDQLVDIANGQSQGNIIATDDIRMAAIRNVAGGKNAYAVNKLLTEVNYDVLSPDLKQELGEALLGNGGGRPPWIGGVVSGRIKSGDATIAGSGRQLIVDTMKASINAGKLSEEVLVNTDNIYLQDLVDTLKADPTFKGGIDKDARDTLLDRIDNIQKESLYSGRIGERKDTFKDLKKLL